MDIIAQESKTGILKDICEISLVVSDNPKAKGIETARLHNIPVAVVPSKNRKKEEHEKEIKKYLQKYNPDYIVLAGYMRILSPSFIKNYRNRIINIHPADTSKYQGKEGYLWAYQNKIKKTAVTVHYVDEGIDTGEVIAKKEFSIEELKTYEEIKARGLAIEHRFYSRVLRELFKR